MKNKTSKVKVSISFSTDREYPVSVRETIMCPEEKKGAFEDRTSIKTPTPILTVSYPSF